MRILFAAIALLMFNLPAKASWIENCLFQAENLTTERIKKSQNHLKIKIISTLELEPNYIDCKKFNGTELKIKLNNHEFELAKSKGKIFVEYLNGDCLNYSKVCKSYTLRDLIFWKKTLNNIAISQTNPSNP